ncbi:four helix bundle protein [Candidatus Gottesmanbacteria bacterium RBG_16_43_7]|uniref:Four helix bundle protein n=1 Tax=Candidatus Gottesmanbacteria bacterium RBG_16_43_7 TaxID=1798373 RepID=A0A1F5Z9Q3_9BACT|nr:MAG: four helix bundle protein [Candidatus Gottesmanbacteria bacterium RBG_16_43_7]
MTQNTKINYDLEDRTTRFSIRIVKLCKSLLKDSVSIPLTTQLIRAGTSIGANYAEANGASSKKDFINKIYLCKKESKETKYWLQIIDKTHPDHKESCRELWREARELTLIFSKIASNTKESKLDKNA